MEARLPRLLLAVVFLSVAGTVASIQAAQHRTPNFVVEAASEQIAEQVGQAAEKFRHDLAVHWLGSPLPKNWSKPCPITVKVGPNLGAGGATSFMFDRGEVYGWRMNIQGSLERVLDSVLPHEVTHTIFASYFRQPLPRWADEGACTTVEHVSERTNHQRHLQMFLRTGRGIPFNRMFEMKDYPQDVMPLYAQGHSVVSFLLQDGGTAKFIQFVSEGLKSEQWIDVTRKQYGYPSLAALQDAWLAWVREGSPDSQRAAPSDVLASNQRPRRPEPNLIYRGQNAESDGQPPAGLARADAPRPGPMSEPAPSGKKFAPLARIRGALGKALGRDGWQPINEQTARPEIARAEALPPEPAGGAVTSAEAAASPRELGGENENLAEHASMAAADDRTVESAQAPSRSGKVLLEWRRKSPPAMAEAKPATQPARENVASQAWGEVTPAPSISRREAPLDASERGNTRLR